MGMPKTKKRPAPLIERDSGNSNDPTTDPPEEQDPVTENRREPDPIPEEGDRGEHSDDDPITRQRVMENLQE